MHTMGLDPADLAVHINGRKAALADMFPGLTASDRLGIVIDSSIGILGASLLLQSFAAAYYQLRRAAGRLVPHYPEMYAFHVGGRYGDLRMLDVLPERKEVFVADGIEALQAINQCAITRIATPGGHPREVSFHPWEVGAVEDRMKSAFLYSRDGRVGDPDIVVTGKGMQVFDSFRSVFDIQHTLDVHGPVEEDPVTWSATLRARADEVAEEDARRARARWQASMDQCVLVESYTALPRGADFLKYLSE